MSDVTKRFRRSPEDGSESSRRTAEKVNIRPHKPITDMTEDELDALADQMADELGLTFGEEPEQGESGAHRM